MKLEEGSVPSERWWLLESSNIKEAAAAEAVEAMAVAPTGSG